MRSWRISGPTGPAPHFGERERAANAFAEAVTRDAKAVPAELTERVRRLFSPQEVVELTVVIGLMNFLTRANTSLAVELEVPPAPPSVYQGIGPG